MRQLKIKKSMMRISVIIILAIMILTWAVPVQAASFDTKVLDGVVFIEVYYVNSNGDLWVISGTGFFVGDKDKDPQYIVTNSHVIDSFVEAGGASGQNSIYIFYDKDDSEEVYLVGHDADMDIAILKVAKPTDKRKPLKLKTIDETQQGQQVFAVGYPSIVDKATNARSSYGKNDATVTSGVVSRILMDSKTGRTDLQIDAAISGGNSGGPLVDVNGYVIGVNTSTIKGENYNFAVSIEEAVRLLTKNVVPFVLASDDEDKSEEVIDEDEGPDLTLIMMIAGVAVILLLIIIIFVLVAKKKSPAAVKSSAASSANAPNVQVPGGAGTGGRAMRGAYIKSLAAQHNGVSMPLDKAPIIIGRDRTVCKVLFNEDTPGVSSKHCQIYFDSDTNDFILTDLGSTYGTFLMNGQKLQSNTPNRLRAKDYFYLGAKDNSFYVDME